MASGIPHRRRSPEGDLQLSRIVRKLESGASALVPTRRRPAPKRPVTHPVKRGCCGQSVTRRPTARSHRMGPVTTHAV
jgi:hypothetical protein